MGYIEVSREFQERDQEAIGQGGYLHAPEKQSAAVVEMVKVVAEQLHINSYESRVPPEDAMQGSREVDQLLGKLEATLDA